MVKETVQLLKGENDKLKEKVDAVFGELKQLKECLKQQHPGSHDASNGDEASATKPLDFLSKQYDDLVKFRKQAEEYLPWRNLWLSYRFLLIILLRRTLQAIQHISYSITHRILSTQTITLDSSFQCSNTHFFPMVIREKVSDFDILKSTKKNSTLSNLPRLHLQPVLLTSCSIYPFQLVIMVSHTESTAIIMYRAPVLVSGTMS